MFAPKKIVTWPQLQRAYFDDNSVSWVQISPGFPFFSYGLTSHQPLFESRKQTIIERQ